MFIYSEKRNVLYKIIAMVLVCLFYANAVVLAGTDTLSPLVGNPEVYQKMQDMMEEHPAEHQGTMDEPKKRNSAGTKMKGLPVGSIANVFSYLCDNNAAEAGGITGQEIAETLDRAYKTIDNDLRALFYHLKLIKKLKEDVKKCIKNSHWYVPKDVMENKDTFIPILEQFNGECIQPSEAMLDKVYKEKIGPILKYEPVKHTDGILKALPQEWKNNTLYVGKFLKKLSVFLGMDNDYPLDRNGSTFIFSEKVTFDNGLGILLPKIARTDPGMRVAVIAVTERQEQLIEEFNLGRGRTEKIMYGRTIPDIMSKARSSRYYYFKVDGDAELDTNFMGVTTFDITALVKKIIDTLGEICGITERKKIELLHNAARKFAEAA